MKFFKNREFDPDGLETVLVNIFVPIFILGIFVSMICFPKVWIVIIAIGFAVGIVWAIGYAIWKAFNLIFPKKKERYYD